MNTSCDHHRFIVRPCPEPMANTHDVLVVGASDPDLPMATE